MTRAAGRRVRCKDGGWQPLREAGGRSVLGRVGSPAPRTGSAVRGGEGEEMCARTGVMGALTVS